MSRQNRKVKRHVVLEFPPPGKDEALYMRALENSDRLHLQREAMRPLDPPLTRVTLGAYLLAVWNLFLTAFTHPTKTTEISLRTGRVVRHF